MISRSVAKHGNLAPCAVDYLKNVPSGLNWYVQQKVRHPAAIYTLSLEKLAVAFNRVANEYFDKTHQYNGNQNGTLDFSKLLELQEIFLKTVQEHLDDCWLVLKTLIDPSKAKTHSIFTDKYVLANKLPGAKYFEQATIDFRNSMRIANKLKHQQGRLRGMGVWVSGAVHLGYFLEEPDKDGYIAPSQDIHPEQSATSFAYELPKRMMDVYACSEKLANAVRAAVHSLSGITLEPVYSVENNWDEVVENLAKFEAAIFPKEVKHGIAVFTLPSQGTLDIQFPVYPRVAFPKQMLVRVVTVVDGYSPSFKVPFP